MTLLSSLPHALGSIHYDNKYTHSRAHSTDAFQSTKKKKIQLVQLPVYPAKNDSINDKVAIKSLYYSLSPRKTRATASWRVQGVVAPVTWWWIKTIESIGTTRAAASVRRARILIILWRVRIAAITDGPIRSVWRVVGSQGRAHPTDLRRRVMLSSFPRWSRRRRARFRSIRSWRNTCQTLLLSMMYLYAVMILLYYYA